MREPPKLIKRPSCVPVRMSPVPIEPWRDERYTNAWKDWCDELEDRSLAFSDWVRSALEREARDLLG